MNSFAIRRLRLHCALFALLLFAISIPAAQAQTGLYGQFSATHFNNLPNTNEWGYGGGFGIGGLLLLILVIYLLFGHGRL